MRDFHGYIQKELFTAKQWNFIAEAWISGVSSANSGVSLGCSAL